MITIKIAKAEPVEGIKIEDRTIEILGEKSQQLGVASFYRNEASELAEVLYMSLPGATFDRL